MRPADTSPEAWKVWVDLMRKISPEVKLQRAIEYTAMVRKLCEAGIRQAYPDRKSTRLNSSHLGISYAVFCLKKQKHTQNPQIDQSKRSSLDVCFMTRARR